MQVINEAHGNEREAERTVSVGKVQHKHGEQRRGQNHHKGQPYAVEEENPNTEVDAANDQTVNQANVPF